MSQSNRIAHSEHSHPDRVVLALVLLAAALRLPGLGARSVWFDEALAGSIARLATTQVLANAAGSTHPPAHYLLLHAWRNFIGDGEYALRFPSAWCSLLAVALVARLGRELWGRRAGRVAALGMALAPFQVVYAQEARMYAAAIALAAAVIWAFLRGVRTGGWAAWWGYGVLAAVGLYVHYYVALVVLALHAWLLAAGRARRRRLLVRLLAADGVAAAAFAPQIVQFLAEAGEYLGGVTSWQPRPHPLAPLATLWALLFGHVTPGGVAGWAWVGAGLFLLLVLLALAVLQLARRGRRDEGWVLVFVVAVPLLLVLLVSFVVHPIYSERSFAVVTPALVPLLAVAAARAPRRSPAPYLGAALAALLAAGTALYHFRPDPVKPPVREAAALVAREAGEADTLLHLQDASYLPALYYAPATAGALLDAGQDTWLTPQVYALFGGRVVPAAGAGAGLQGRVWLTVMPGYVGDAQAAWLSAWEAERTPDGTWQWVGIQVCVYSPRSE